MMTRHLDRIRSEWSRNALRWTASLGALFVLGSFTFVVFSFLAFQLQSWMID